MKFLAIVAVVGLCAVSLIGCGGGNEEVLPVTPAPSVLLVSTTPMEWGKSTARLMGGKYIVLAESNSAEVLSLVRRTAQNSPCLLYFFGEYQVPEELDDFDCPDAGLVYQSKGERPAVLPFVELSQAAGWSSEQVWSFDGSEFSMPDTYEYFGRNSEGVLYGPGVPRAMVTSCWFPEDRPPSFSFEESGKPIFGSSFFQAILDGGSIYEAVANGATDLEITGNQGVFWSYDDQIVRWRPGGR